MSSTATDTDPETGAQTTATTGPADLDVTVDAVADAPDLSVSAEQTLEDTSVALNITTTDVDVDGSEVISSVEIAGIPSGAVLSAGTDSGLTITLSADGSDGHHHRLQRRRLVHRRRPVQLVFRRPLHPADRGLAA